MPAIAVISLLAPILLPGILLIVVLRRGWLRPLAVPIDRGALLRARPVFGATKTWLGVLGYLVGAIVVCAALGAAGVGAAVFREWPGAFVGLLVGVAYNVGELANSFVKRRLGVASSALTGSRWRHLQHAVDLGDGILVVFVVYLALGVPLALAVAAGVAGFAVHVLTDVVMHRIGLKRRG